MKESFSHRKEFPWHRRNKKKAMQLSFRVCQICRDRDNHESIMDKRIELRGNMVVGLMEGTSQIRMT